MEATELPPDAKSPDNCPAGNMASASFRELLWEDKHGMEQLGWIKITASNEDEEAARTIIKKMKPDMEGTRHDTPPTQLEVTNDTHQRTLARSVPPTTSWLDEEHQKIFKTFMEAGVDVCILYLSILREIFDWLLTCATAGGYHRELFFERRPRSSTPTTTPRSIQMRRSED